MKTALPPLGALLLLLAPLAAVRAVDGQPPTARPPIDRHALVARHSIKWNEIGGQIPLGNGEFCFNADGLGLQTFGGNSMSHWGWHSFPLPTGWTADRVPSTGTFQQGRNKGPDVFPKDRADIRQWMFDNPHMMNLGRLPCRRCPRLPREWELGSQMGRIEETALRFSL